MDSMFTVVTDVYNLTVYLHVVNGWVIRDNRNNTTSRLTPNTLKFWREQYLTIVNPELSKNAVSSMVAQWFETITKQFAN